jgi:hypothetical protein
MPDFGSHFQRTDSQWTRINGLLVPNTFSFMGLEFQTNQPPVANAGANQTVQDSDDNGSQGVTLNGSLSSDPDNNIDTYVWKEFGSTIATGVTPNVTFSVGVHTVELTVTDTNGAFDTDTVQITVEAAPNQPPQANAGSNQTVEDGDNSGSESVTLNGSASNDPDGSIVSYIWRENGSQIASGVSPNVNFSVGVHTVELTVTDNEGGTNTDTVTITVQEQQVDGNGPTYAIFSELSTQRQGFTGTSDDYLLYGRLDLAGTASTHGVKVVSSPVGSWAGSNGQTIGNIKVQWTTNPPSSSFSFNGNVFTQSGSVFSGEMFVHIELQNSAVGNITIQYYSNQGRTQYTQINT